MQTKEYIEDSILRRLLDNSKDVKEVTNEEFESILESFRPTINYSARTPVSNYYQDEGELLHKLPFTEEDMKSFFVMKTHQMYRRGQIDPARKSSSFYLWRALNRLTKDILRINTRCLRNELDLDELNLSMGLIENQDYSVLNDR